MKNKPLISVIVPVYNVEEFLERCVNSIINQTYKKLEILLVDDGSKDNSGKICDELSKKDERIKVFHKKNGGLSDARNYGIKKSKSEYVVFIDSDDYINKNMISVLYEELSKNNADIAFCDFKITTNSDEDLDKKIDGRVKVFNRIEAFYGLYTPYATRLICCCIKLFKKKIFDDLEFPYRKINEDLAITHYIIDKTDRIVGIDAKYYYYYQRPGSIMHSFDNRYLDSLSYLEDRKNFFEKMGDEVLVEYTDYYYCLKACILYNEAVRKKEFKDTTRNLKKQIRGKAKIVLKNKNNTIFQKIISLSFYLMPTSYRLMEFINLKIINRK